MTRVALAPLTEPDLALVSAFLVEHLQPGVTAETWRRALEIPWQRDAPNRGFVLTADGVVVGAHLAFYSSRVIRGEELLICNLGPWCVLDEHRAQGLRLLRAVLKQPGMHFTDLSPSGSVVPLNERLGFKHLDTATSLAANLPWLSRPGRVRVTSSRRVIEATLTGDALQVYRDHADLVAARHLLVSRGDEHCHVVFRRDRRKGLPLFASILHVSHPDLFRASWRAVARHLLLRHRLPLTLAEQRVVAGRLAPSVALAAHRTKMFRSDVLEPGDVDYLYSELVCLPW